MRETAAEITSLQGLLDASAGRAGSHLRSIINAPRRLTAKQIVTELQGMRVLVVATVTAAGDPRTSCVDGHFLRGAWIFATDTTAYKARHLRLRPTMSATYVDGERVAVFTHGTAVYMTAEHEDFAHLDAYFTEHYGSSPTTWGGETVFLRIHPTWMSGYAMEAQTFPEGS